MLKLTIIGGGTLRQNSHRVLRGGSWINDASNLRSANRNANHPDNRNHNIGLRLAGALLVLFNTVRGSINQWCFLFENVYCSQQNQDSQRASKLISENLLLSRLFLWWAYCVA